MSGANRREFLRDCVLASGTLALRGAETKRVLVEAGPQPSFQRRLAERELLRGLSALQLSDEVGFSEPNDKAGAGDLVFRLRLDPARFKDKQAYSIATRGTGVIISAAAETGLLYAVFDFLEHQGAYFGIDGENYPPDAAGKLALPVENRPWEATPRFGTRGLLPWPDFLNCISVYNEEDFRAYFEAMLRMRFNLFGMHVYTSPTDTESFLSFEFGGVGHTGYLDNSASSRWGYLPERTSRYGMGASQFYDSEVFGADATRLSRDPWEIADRTRAMLARSLSYARKLGMATGIGFEPYQTPGEIFRALPPESRPAPQAGAGRGAAARVDLESVTARKLLEARLAALLEAYPDVDYVWLWEDEGMGQSSRQTGIPLSTTPFTQAHDFLRRNAPKKRLVLSGWGGVARNFESFHTKLPGDVVFSCLNDSLGWDPVAEAFGKLEGRERWPIPWLEDDPAMWLPQYHVNRTQRDMNLASQMGCQGILGIHWRHRMMDATAGYLARAAWDKSLTPESHFRDYARSQTAGSRAPRLASVLDDLDLRQKVLNTGTDQVRDGHAVIHEYAGDYGEGFTFWGNSEPSPDIVQAQKQVAAALREIADSADSPVERERLEYLTGFVEFAVPYTDAWTLAHRLNGVLAGAAKLKSGGDAEGARRMVRADGVPLWLTLAPLVRGTMLRYQRIVATREDLGQLASMHNKFVRLALVRLRLSIQEYLGELPPETEKLLAEVTQPDPHAPARLFIPTRPGVLAKGERVRIMIVAVGPAPASGVTLNARVRGTADWVKTPARLMGRRTYEAYLGPFGTPEPLAEYYVSASIGGKACVAPPEAPRRPHQITLV